MRTLKTHAITYEEAEANQFAMELLMPTQFVRDEVAKLKGGDIADDKFIKLLAAKFQVPVGIMGIRLGQVMMDRPPF